MKITVSNKSLVVGEFARRELAGESHEGQPSVMPIVEI